MSHNQEHQHDQVAHIAAEHEYAEGDADAQVNLDQDHSQPELDESNDIYNDDGFESGDESDNDEEEEDDGYDSGYTDNYYSDVEGDNNPWAGGATDDGEQFEFNYITKFTLPICQQQDSRLFSLPEELLSHIYTFVFTDYETDQQYDFDTCYRRPGYLAPRKTDTAFLRSCQNVYRNAWFMPWTLSRQTIYLAWQNRRPDHSTTTKDIRKCCEFIAGIRDNVEIGSVQVFAQQCNLGNFGSIMGIQNFYPKEVVLTIRHTDFWSWESDADLAFDIHSILDVKFPDSVRRFVIEFESLSRKKEAVDAMLNCLGAYRFARENGTSLKPGEISSMTWEGSSSWEDTRWIRDEEDSKPGKLTYYVGRRVFVPSKKKRGDFDGDYSRVEVSDEINERVRYKGPMTHREHIHVNQLEVMCADSGRKHQDVPASEIMTMMNHIAAGGRLEAWNNIEE